MTQDTNYQQKFQLLQPWFSYIIESVKKDIRQEHLQKDVRFAKNFFGNKPLQRITNDELVDVYGRLIDQGEEKIAEFVAVRWLLKHSDLYGFFEQELSKITQDFDKLEVLDDKESQNLIDQALNQFGPIKTYLFSVFNSVVFPQHHLDNLRIKAQESLSKLAEESKKQLEAQSFDDLKKNFDIEMQRIVDKYEKKLSGLQKKYIMDTENLKKQISGLQRKLT
jgi:hypothetical protein